MAKYVELGQSDNREVDLTDARLVRLKPETEQLVVEPTTAEQNFVPSAEKYFDKVVVDAIDVENVSVKSDTSDKVIKATDGKFIQEVLVERINPSDYYKPEESVMVTPKPSSQTISAQDGKVFNEVLVKAVDSELEPNLIATNIRKGKSIFGVNGNLEPDKPDQEKTVEASIEHDVVVQADIGYELAKVTIPKVDVSAYVKEEISVDVVPSETTQAIRPADNKVYNQVNVEAIPSDYVGSEISRIDGKQVNPLSIEQIIVNADSFVTGDISVLPIEVESKDVKSTEERQIITPNENKYINEVIVEPLSLESVEISPSKVSQQILPSGENDGIKKVTINAVTNTIDENIKSANIKKGVEILGIEGSLVGGGTDSSSKFRDLMYFCAKMVLYKNTSSSSKFTLDNTSNINVVSDENFSSDNVTNTSYMFYNNPQIEIPKFNTGNVTDMSYMFMYCGKLTTIPQLNTSNVTNMTYMFSNCSALITVPQLDTSNVTNMSYMFNYCTSLTTVPQLDTGNAIDMTAMFMACGKLTTIPQLNTSNVFSTRNMFSNCSALITVPQLDTSNVTNMSYMFNYCTSLTTVPQLDTSNATSMQSLFYGCTHLITVPYLDTDKVTDMSYMFYNCTSLVTVERLDMIKATSISLMFNGCNKLENLNLKNVKTALRMNVPLLSLDSLTNTIKELWDYSSGTSSRTLTIGSENTSKIADTYVKLITPTAEQIEADPNINNKMPCEVCKSTDEGAILITDYALLKKWSIA